MNFIELRTMMMHCSSQNTDASYKFHYLARSTDVYGGRHRNLVDRAANMC